MSELATSQKAYRDNAGYDAASPREIGVTMAKTFVVACRQLILDLPSLSEDERTAVRLNPELIDEQLKRAMSWLENNDPDNTSRPARVGQTYYADFSNYRGGA